MVIKRVLGGAALALALLVGACGGGSGTAPEASTPLPAAVTVVGPSRAERGAALQWQSSVGTSARGLSFEWRFGDGTTSDAPAPTHAYAQPGVYELELSVRDHAGAVISARRLVRVGAFPMVAGLQCSGPNESGWCWQSPTPNGNEGLDVTFVDAREGWMVGEGGLILHTADGAQSWTPQTVPAYARLLRVSFGDARHGWIAAADGSTWVTQDGGATWRAGGALGLERIDRVWSRGTRLAFATGTAAGDSARSVYSVDGGLSWRTTPAPFVIDRVDTDGTLWSTDGRETATVEPWQARPLPAELQRMSGLGIDDSGFAYGMTQDRKLATRPAAGQAWTFTPLMPPPSDAPSIPGQVTIDRDGLGLLLTHDALNQNPRWARTVDFGRQWAWIDSWPAGWALRGNLVVDGRTVWGVFTDGTRRGYWLSVDAGLTWRRLFPQLSTLDDCCGWYPVTSLQRQGDGALVARIAGVSPAGWFRSADDGATWTPLPAPGGRRDVAQVWAGSGGRLFAAVGDVVHDSADQGRHWAAREAATPGVADAFNRPDGRGWTVDHDDLLQTSDAWLTWTRTPLPRADAFGSQRWGQPLSVLYADGPRIRMLTLGTAACPRMCATFLVISDDGGLTFDVAVYVRPWFATADVAMAVSSEGLLRSTNAGRSWTRVAPSPNVGTRRIRFVDADRGWIVGDGNSLWRTADGGQTWTEVRLPAIQGTGPANAPVLNDIAFGDAMHGWVVGNNGIVLATEDGGEHWRVQASGTSLNLLSVIASSKSTAWIGGAQGTILATVSGGWVDP